MRFRSGHWHLNNYTNDFRTLPIILIYTKGLLPYPNIHPLLIMAANKRGRDDDYDDDDDNAGPAFKRLNIGIDKSVMNGPLPEPPEKPAPEKYGIKYGFRFFRSARYIELYANL